jgi:hypothetical protein
LLLILSTLRRFGRLVLRQLLLLLCRMRDDRRNGQEQASHHELENCSPHQSFSLSSMAFAMIEVAFSPGNRQRHKPHLF